MNQIDATERKAFLVSAITISIAIWDTAFFLGVHGAIFFEKLFALWVAATVVSMISLFWPDMIGREILGNRGRVALALPTLWLIAVIIDPQAAENGLTDWAVSALGIVAMLIALPYLVFVGTSVLVKGPVGWRDRRLLIPLAVIAMVVGAIGYLAGHHSELLLSCWDFRISGNQVPNWCER